MRSGLLLLNTLERERLGEAFKGIVFLTPPSLLKNSYLECP
jgi:hypothetical protein